MSTTKSNSLRSLRKRKSTSTDSLVPRTNALSLSEITTRFLPPSTELSFSLPNDKKEGNPGDGKDNTDYSIHLETSTSMSEDDFGVCFGLVKSSLEGLYRGSEFGWSSTKKRKEMKHPALRYLLLRCECEEPQGGEAQEEEEWEDVDEDEEEEEEKDGSTKDNDEEPNAAKTPGTKGTEGAEKEKKKTKKKTKRKGRVVGFLSFMITEEHIWEVIYTYEINISPAHQSRGLGKKLIDVMEHFGRQVGVEKSMLTVFNSNQRAKKMYEKCGYVVDEEWSPEPKKLRSGEVKESSYEILCKKFR